MRNTKLWLEISKEKYTLQEFTDFINFMLQNEALENAYWITHNKTTIKMQRISIQTAYLETLYIGIAIITTA